MSDITYEDRVQIMKDAIDLKSTSRVPVAPFIANLPLHFATNDVNFRDVMYNPEKAADAFIDFYRWFRPDMSIGTLYHCGPSNEIAETTYYDWPGQPGKNVPDYTTYQCHEIEYMMEDEYPELLSDFTGFMLRKLIPRAYPGVAGLSTIGFSPSSLMGSSGLNSMMTPAALEAYGKLQRMSEFEAIHAAAGDRVNAALQEFGIPTMFQGIGLAPFDALSDNFRGTTGAWLDLISQPDNVQAACDLFADIQIASWGYYDYLPLPFKCVFFPLHKGMDGLMSPEQFDKIYWKPLLKLVNHLADRGIYSLIYSEGFYNTRIHHMEGLPVGKTIVHMEYADPTECKKVFGDTAVLSGFIPLINLDWGTKEKVIEETKYFLDKLADGKGYIFDTVAAIETAKRENFDAMMETVYNWY
ncbi:MAG: hypothetical protein LBU61_06860 [Coriobacteriales bacterium]|nr:hypothetical protein [Coriobacteriales bacterium]